MANTGGNAAKEFQLFFLHKVDNFRRATDSADPPMYHSNQSMDVLLDKFASVTVGDVLVAIRHLPNKSSAADLIPTPLLKHAGCRLSCYVSN
jgi:hypothetical protein